MTSANVIEFRILKLGKEIGHHRENILTKNHYDNLLKFQPLSEHTITPYGYDEDEEYWEDKSENLNSFLKKKIRINSVIKEYFEKEK